MTDNRSTRELPLEHDEFHSSLEVDDTSGWRIFIVPALMLIFVIGAVVFTIFYGA